LFARLNQRAGFTMKPICPSMLRDTYAIRFLQAGGDLHDLQEQLGLADRASVRRYQRFCDEQRRKEPEAQASSGQAKPPLSARRGKRQRQKAKRRK
jgi:site-specific recombinase XerD